MANKFDQVEVAKKLGITVSSILRDIEAGKLTGSKVGSHYLFTLRDLEKYIGARRANELFGEGTQVVEEGKKKALSIGPPVKQCEVCERLRPSTDFEYDGTQPDWLGKVCYACRRQKSGKQWPPQE